ncbi:hypothetical protein TVAG_453740 [Trichomonas vaginalis G3]|uniref:Uncharacterized protein n=1 Tax=Trichomonas vaginalis (strain ATCC PRA-98 / G3) TaxID=412133 RepID=A2DPV0_TRIV3|nr:protein of unknown function (DUF4598) family [Trichomonas vaginalis G3]EAY17546.1 hypothetical protein TVAG_453740 [Trichomonas vaginalis G3]KAI5520590.1 protein of unknown function (DUF4598) family [Trichomonas vaginalis G3]|eukprot:XP_001329681.1 hypothetical protein [Trichomonas vaginalis G3]
MSKPFPVARSALLDKAAAFAKMLKEDNERIQKFLDEGGDRNEISVDVLDPNDDQVIEMEIIPGVLESQAQQPEIHEDIQIPASEFHRDSNLESAEN